MRAAGEKYNLWVLIRCLNKMSRPADSLADGELKTILGTFAEAATKLQEVVDVPNAPKTVKDTINAETKVQSIIAVWSMQIGFILLAIGAVKLFLAF